MRPASTSTRALFSVLVAVFAVLYPGLTRAESVPAECASDCWVLSKLTLRGAVGGDVAFELTGGVRSKEEQRIPLFGPPSDVRLDDVSLDGGRAAITFDSDRYYVLTSARAFTLRGRIKLGADQLLRVEGPVMAVDAYLTKGRLVEGDKLSGISSAVLHFDSAAESDDARTTKPKEPPVFRLSRAIRFGRETTFLYRLFTSQSTELGTVRLPLRFGEKIKEVQGSTGWIVDGETLLLPTTGREVELTIAGVLPATDTLRKFSPDDRSVYEWWMVEADPEHRVWTSGDAKLVETTQSPIPPSMPDAHVFLVQRSQVLEVTAKSLIRGEALAAVARTARRFVAITANGEVITDESVAFENNGLDNLMLLPAGRPMYLSTDAVSQPLLHVEAGQKEILVPFRPGPHSFRVQSLDNMRIWPLAGVLRVPASSYPLATSFANVTVGLPDTLRPIAVVGGDQTQWAFGKADLVAMLLGTVVAALAFRTKRTRILGALATAALWFVSHQAFVLGASVLFVAGSVFLILRFVRGNWRIGAVGAALVVALLGGRWAMLSDAATDARDIFAERPSLPMPEASVAAIAPDGSLDTKVGIRPVSMSFPLSDHYVQTGRQLVTQGKPFTPQVFFVTSTLVDILHCAWFLLVAMLVWAHKDQLLLARRRILALLTRRDDPLASPARAPLPF